MSFSDTFPTRTLAIGDGDGFDDGFEVAASYNPTVASNTPAGATVLLKEFGVADSAEYRFNAANGVSDRMEAATNLVNWTTIEANIVGAGSVVARFYSTGGQSKRFFRSRRN